MAAEAWSTPKELKDQVQTWWDRGLLLRDGLLTASAFPKPLVLKKPSTQAWAERFSEARAWDEALQALPLVRLERVTREHRLLGANPFVSAAWVDRVEDAVLWLGKGQEAKAFAALVAVCQQQAPQLLPWLAKHPLKALALRRDFAKLLSVVAWLQARPLPGLYLRQMDLPGVHTKLVEGHQGVLGEWLALSLPPEARRPQGKGFTERHGFLAKPERIRFRSLDPACAPAPGWGGADVTLDANSFAALRPEVRRLWVIENETNFLAFPQVPGAWAVFGAGYGFEALAQAEWLRGCELWYWGDIDTHGLAMLDALRGHFPHLRSFLMDETTFQAASDFWGHEPSPTARALTRLTPAEQALHQGLLAGRWGERLRLEQEHVAYGQVLQALAALGGPTFEPPRPTRALGLP